MPRVLARRRRARERQGSAHLGPENMPRDQALKKNQPANRISVKFVKDTMFFLNQEEAEKAQTAVGEGGGLGEQDGSASEQDLKRAT
ncbi:hypothetical protein GSI_01557 [Ganoderma sinense ZZ0214-1]|uniref:Uncharacterized protein n=1 Tax=Ganoderma sinense ZZ0214-1 TaxID=1077348 RepID=A0A2G8SQ46_9APHY|nr:hypothetical protein GSI_01557 [Ganoderma sinense ZZ0214-1]